MLGEPPALGSAASERVRFEDGASQFSRSGGVPHHGLDAREGALSAVVESLDPLLSERVAGTWRAGTRAK